FCAMACRRSAWPNQSNLRSPSRCPLYLLLRRGPSQKDAVAIAHALFVLVIKPFTRKDHRLDFLEPCIPGLFAFGTLDVFKEFALFRRAELLESIGKRSIVF